MKINVCSKNKVVNKAAYFIGKQDMPIKNESKAEFLKNNMRIGRNTFESAASSTLTN